MTNHGTLGTSLLELLVALSITTVLVSGAALHFRTLRQAGDLAHARREAAQNARVALTRIARQLRAASAIADISNPDNKQGFITSTDADGNDHVFSRQPGADELRYGIDAADDLLATGIKSLYFQGYDAQGEVPQDEPERIEAVQVTLTASIPDSADTITLGTRVRLRRHAAAGKPRSHTSYASVYEQLDEYGLVNYDLAFGEPDGLFAYLDDEGSARYSGFSEGPYAATIHSIQAGVRLGCRRGDLKVQIKLAGKKKYSVEYKSDDLTPFLGRWDWLWIDITEEENSWDETDIPDLSIEVKEGRADCVAGFDSFAVRALFDEPETTLVWADRQGDGQCPNEWQDADNAIGAPDDVYAAASWADQHKQSYRATATSTGDEILAVHVALSGYLVAPYNNKDKIALRIALPDESTSAGITYVAEKETLRDYVGQENKGIFFINVTGSRPWTWDALSDCEIRLGLVKDRRSRGPTMFMADAIGWRVTHAPESGKGISQWSE